LVSGLSQSKIRWERDVAIFDEHYGLLAGNVLLSSAFFSYLGPFPSEYRDDIFNNTMIATIAKEKISFTKKWSFISFQANDMLIKTWKSQGLPTDEFSQQNGVLVLQGRRWPLCIDP